MSVWQYVSAVAAIAAMALTASGVPRDDSDLRTYLVAWQAVALIWIVA